MKRHLNFIINSFYDNGSLIKRKILYNFKKLIVRLTKLFHHKKTLFILKIDAIFIKKFIEKISIKNLLIVKSNNLKKLKKILINFH